MNIVIVGAGLLGRLFAWRLSSLGHNISLLESGDFEKPSSAAYTAAAMISPLSEVAVSDRLIFNLGQHSLSLWPNWIAALNEENPELTAVQYQANGSIAVAHAQDDAELQQFKSDISAKLKDDDSSSWLDRSSISELEPSLAHFSNGLFLPGEAHLDNRQLLSNLLHTIRERGVTCQDHCLVDFEKDTQDSQKQIESADWVLDCRGMGAKSDVNRLRGVRGEIMWVESKDIQLRHPVRLMHPRYKLYVVPKPQHRFIVGATEIESEDLSPISLQSNLELASALYTINPAFAEARVIETDTNLRPTFRDNNPRVQKLALNNSKRQSNILQINGLYRHGYLLAPSLVDHVCNWLEDKKPGAYWHKIYKESN